MDPTAVGNSPRERVRAFVRRFRPSTRRGRIILWTVLGLYASWLLIGGLVLPPVLRSVLERQMSQNLRAACTIEDVSLNPFTLRIGVHGVKVPNPDGKGVLFSFRELSLAPSPAALVRLAPSLASARIVEPLVDIAYHGEGRFSFSGLVPPPAEAESSTQQATDTPLFPFVISDFELVDGRFVFRDEVHGVTHTIDDIDFVVPFTSSLDMFRDTPITPSLNATVDGSRVTVEGRLLPFADTLRTEFDIATEDVALDQFRAYLKPFTPLVLERGAARLEIDLLVERHASGKVELGLGGSLHLEDIEVQSPDGAKVAALRSGELRLGKFTLAERRVEVEAIDMDGLYVKATRGLDGGVDWQRWLSGPVGSGSARGGAAGQGSTPEVSGKAAAIGAGKPGGAAATTTAKAGATSNVASGGDKGAGKGLSNGLGPVGAQNASRGERASAAVASPAAGASAAASTPAVVDADRAFVVQGAALHLKDGTVVWRDESLAASREVAVTGLDVQIPHFSTAAKEAMPFTVAFGLGGEGRLVLEGKASLAPFVMDARLAAQGLPLAAARPFLGGTPAADISGKFGAGAMLALRAGDTVGLRVSDGRIMLEDIALGGVGKLPPAVATKSMELSGLAVDLAGQSVKATALRIVDPSVALVLDDTGMPGLPVSQAGNTAEKPQRKPGAKAASQKTAPATKRTQAKAETVTKGTPARPSARRASPAGAASAQQKPWALGLDTLEMTGGRVSVSDRKGGSPLLAVTELKLTAGPLSPDLSGRVKFESSMRWQNTGTLALRGQVRPQPLELDLAVKTAKVDLAPLDIVLGMKTALQTGGNVSSDLKVDVRERDDSMHVRASGGLQLDDARLRRQGERKDFVTLRRFALRDFRYESSPLRIEAGDMLIDRPQFTFVLHKDGTTNVLRALDPEGAERRAAEVRAAAKTAKAAKPEEKKSATGFATDSEGTARKVPAQAASPDSPSGDAVAVAQPAGAGQVASPPSSAFDRFSLGRLTLKGGQLRFRDERFSPAYDATLDRLDVNVSGFSTASDNRATLDAGGTFEGVPMTLTGTINPVSTPPFADVSFAMQGFDLVPLSPYALHYIAYPVDKGRLSAQLQLKTSDWVLSADSKFLLEGIELGDKDTRPGAPDYPVKLGIALLQGLDGNVSIDLPVRGRLDDPNFRLGGVVLQAVMNLMVKVVTSPFALVGSVVRLAGGSSADMRNVPFEPGRDTLTERAEEQLKGIAEVLNQRPGLTLEVRGLVDPVADDAGLREVALLRRMQEVKYASLWRGKRASTTVDAMIVEPDEYDDLLETVYGDAPFEKPRNVLGLVKGQPREVMEKALYENMTITPEDMEALAQARAHAVRDRLLGLDASLGARLSLAATSGKGRSAVEMLLR